MTMVADRESDIYPLFALRPAGLDLILRVAQNRSLADGERLFQALHEAPLLATRQVKVAPRGPGDKGRIAEIELRSSVVTIARPRNGCDDALPETVTMTFLEAREVAPPPGKTALLWRLLTTHAINSAADAEEIVNFTACAGASNSCSDRSRATGLRLRTPKSSTPSVCSTSPQSPSPPPSAHSNWSMPEMAARAQQAMSSTIVLLSHSTAVAQTRRRDRQAEKSPSARLARLRRLDRSTPRGLELLLRKARTKDHARRLEPTRHNTRWIRPCYSWAKSVNPVARKGGGVRGGGRE